jgi:hypothetical protein
VLTANACFEKGAISKQDAAQYSQIVTYISRDSAVTEFVSTTKKSIDSIQIEVAPRDINPHVYSLTVDSIAGFVDIGDKASAAEALTDSLQSIQKRFANYVPATNGALKSLSQDHSSDYVDKKQPYHQVLRAGVQPEQ